MIVYENTVSGFCEDVITSEVVDKIKSSLRSNHIGFSDHEIKSWRDSTRCMKDVLNQSSVPQDADVFIEYNVPFTNSRIDFCISGRDGKGFPNAVIVELKGWSEGISVSKLDSSMIHVNFYGNTDVMHPSYQAWSYANYILNFNSEVVDGQIGIIPCTYLYNMSASKGEMILEDDYYEYYTEKAKVFYSTDLREMSKYFDRFITDSDHGETMKRIENGKPTVSSSLQKSLRRVLTEKDFFAPMERQTLTYNIIKNEIRSGFEKREKKVLIVRGGPGTGKSVLALKLLADLNSDPEHFIHTQYVTKTSAPRATYKKELTRLAKEIGAGQLFAGASNFVDTARNYWPAILVDEAHRLTTRSSQYSKGKDQVKEIINAALVSVFFIDEDQIVSMSDIGTVDYIYECAQELGAKVICNNNLVLSTQFRCKGSGLYIAWVDDVLGIRESKDLELLGKMPYEIEIIDTPDELVERITAKRNEGFNSRIVAGYCWDWTTKGNSGSGTDISFADSEIALRWNTSTDTWGNNDEFCEEIGCIHSSQGLEYQYGGVIIGNDMIFRDGKVVTVPEARSDTRGTMKGWKNDPDKADRIIRNTYRTLMTRGMCGCFVYCTDGPLRDYLKERLRQFE